MDPSLEDFSANLSTENHGQIILQRLEEQRATKLCDVVVLSSDRRKYPCHKAVLAANSTLLRDKAMKSNKIQTDIAAEVLELILDYFYTGSVRIEENNCIELLDASVSLMVTPLEGAISHYIKRVAQENTRPFIESSMLLKVPPNLMKNAIGDILIANSFSKRALLLQVVEALADWAAVDHATRWEVYRELLERVKSDKNTSRQTSCPVTPLSYPSSIHSSESANHSASPSSRSTSVDSAAVMQHSTPLGIFRSRNMVLPSTSTTEDQGDMYFELELSKVGRKEENGWDCVSELATATDKNSEAPMDASMATGASETTWSQYEREMREVIEELKAKQLSDDEDIKL
ncbi:uncharacterized protein LOC111267018 isoform X1 [Varroa jacobsoni]|uniref:uncharacterized protein LOC111267018 isoform X1 n=1 Tax=Varroa jacobsoni TaxID=62625 RepID=UPI000BF7961C|nr:uncharacterized protein LOC111267018 isoform X1 [Varroa jacobsoni]